MKHDPHEFPGCRLLSLAAEWQHDEAVQIYLANYRTNAQLALDCNLPGEERKQYLDEKDINAWALASRLLHLTRTVPLVPNEHPSFF